MKTILRAVLVIVAGSAISAASTTQIWEQKTAEEFEKGEASGVSITSDGRLQLAPPLDLAYDTGEIYAWALAHDSRGRIFISGGNGGKVFVFTPASGSPGTGSPGVGSSAGSGSLFFKAAEIEAHALAVDSADNLYVGSSPDGKVYKVSPDGKSSVFFEPKTKYIWSLAFDRKGNLWVATGDRGELFRVDRQGKGSVIYKSGDKHIRTLAALDDGVVAGTEGRARIVRVSSDGTAFVLYDAPVREITSVVLAPDGTIYAAGIGAAQHTPQRITSSSSSAPPPAMPVTLESLTSVLTEGGIQVPTRSGIGGLGSTTASAHSTEVYRIAPDGYPRRIWKSDKVTAFSLALAPDGDVLVGTGDKGVVYKLRPDARVSSMLVRAGGSQITALLADGSSHAVYAATSNLGRLYRLGSGFAKEGAFQSQVKDASIFSRWGRLRWKVEAASESSVKVYTRSGNTQEPDSTWSPWSEALVQSGGQPVTSPQARFFQWKAQLAASGGSTPVLQSVEVAYLPRNVAPEINSIVIHPRDLVMERFQIIQDQQAVPQIMPSGQTSGSGASFAPTAAMMRPSRTTMRKGWQTVTWDARDDNGDTMVYSIYIKGDSEAEWKLMRDRLEDNFFSWDTTNFPDGAYAVKIVASDGPSNPSELALAAERVSDRFYIDNTAPVISALAATAEGGGRVRVRFHAADSATLLSKAEYSVDGAQLCQVFPVDSIFDSEAKDFDFVISGVGPGEHTIAVKVADRSNNQSSAKALITGR
jgi:WD40 repeat protein